MADFSVVGPNEQMHGTATPIGPQIIDTLQGRCLFVDAPGITVGSALKQNPENSRVVVMVYDPDMQPGPDGIGTGLMVQVDAHGAARLAASLLRMADQIGRKVQ